MPPKRPISRRMAVILILRKKVLDGAVGCIHIDATDAPLLSIGTSASLRKASRDGLLSETRRLDR